MCRLLAAAVSLLVLAAGCGNHRAPSVKGKPFPAALARLRADGWLVSVPSFPRVDGGLEDYRVAAQRTSGRRTVTLKVVVPSQRKVVLMAVGENPPLIPRLVGHTYRNAHRFALRGGVALSVSTVAPLRAAASVDGIDAFVVVSQRLDGPHAVAVTLGERPCWKTVIQDWLIDTRIDGTYARRCYREALDALPDDGPVPEVEQALRSRLR